jgi:hypothetical protein
VSVQIQKDERINFFPSFFWPPSSYNENVYFSIQEGGGKANVTIVESKENKNVQKYQKGFITLSYI